MQRIRNEALSLCLFRLGFWCSYSRFLSYVLSPLTGNEYFFCQDSHTLFMPEHFVPRLGRRQNEHSKNRDRLF